ncbi:MurR/RpiR family transcriptional regulator [Propionispira raffinosivorans]|uniref:MurR/RpiR family transcriptional regulator n=1 Tax=Propionispira raffinosivorans TaxID=86959 RepID=UPI00037639C1|nr:MurR/RpiR family transcriptional regulator [Propionispira raffinosivorans]
MKDPKLIQNFEELNSMLMHVAKESPTYQKIAVYIEKNYLRIIFMTANELADQLGISQGSVSRFFIALGYRGYNDFLRTLQNIVSEKLTAPQRLQYSKQHKKQDNPLRDILDIELANMDELINIMQGKAYENLINMIISDKQLILLSARMSATILPYVGYILNKMRSNVFQLSPNSPMWDTLELCNPEDVNIVTVMFPRYPKILVQKCSSLKEKGFHIAGVTDNHFSPAMNFCESTVFVPATTSSIFDIYSTPIAFFNLLLRDAAKQMPELDQRMEQIEQIERENEVYFK